ncbi:hypothetical protein F383_29975 [Gossypium arboreum]|uniref:Uncharacterized protein n=1 Tax=Gossypium arboreum TaxID=29729 RepID=A0A0B0MQN7_GOSAR|nr:hypothetical protein F383_29975 [Gossypium arboreum]
MQPYYLGGSITQGTLVRARSFPFSDHPITHQD